MKGKTMADQPNLYLITENLLTVTKNYLMQRPMSEVRLLVEAFERATIHKPTPVATPTLVATPTAATGTETK